MATRFFTRRRMVQSGVFYMFIQLLTMERNWIKRISPTELECETSLICNEFWTDLTGIRTRLRSGVIAGLWTWSKPYGQRSGVIRFKMTLIDKLLLRGYPDKFTEEELAPKPFSEPRKKPRRLVPLVKKPPKPAPARTNYRARGGPVPMEFSKLRVDFESDFFGEIQAKPEYAKTEEFKRQKDDKNA